MRDAEAKPAVWRFITALALAVLVAAGRFSAGYRYAYGRSTDELAESRSALDAARAADESIRAGIAEAQSGIARSTESIERSLGSIATLGSIQAQFRVVIAELGKYIAAIRAEYEALEALVGE